MMKASSPAKHGTTLWRTKPGRGCSFNEDRYEGDVRVPITMDDPYVFDPHMPTGLGTPEQRIAKLEFLLQLNLGIFRALLKRESVPKPSLKGEDYPALVAVWDNADDDIFDHI